MGALHGLDDPCSTCRRRTGDHTLDEHNQCLGAPALDLPYQEAPGGPVNITLNGENITWADHLTARSAIMRGRSGTVDVALPTVIFTFQIGSTTTTPTDVAQIAYLGSPAVLRKLGRVLRDTCNVAANAAEKVS